MPESLSRHSWLVTLVVVAFAVVALGMLLFTGASAIGGAVAFLLIWLILHALGGLP